jgi:uncharacterized membrane protein YidH (DUF202 family)
MTKFLLIFSLSVSLFFNTAENRVSAASNEYSTAFQIISQDSTKKVSEQSPAKSLKNRSAGRSLLYAVSAYALFYLSVATLAMSATSTSYLLFFFLAATLSFGGIFVLLGAGIYHFFKGIRLFRRNKELTGRGNLVFAGILLLPAFVGTILLLYYLGMEVFRNIR